MNKDLLGDLNIVVSASTVAWYAAILSTLGAIKVLSDLWNDRGRIKLEWLFDMRMTGEKDIYFLVRVINKGRRPIKITHVATKLYGQTEIGLLGHSFTHENRRILTEERPSTEYPVVQGDISPKSLWFVAVTDARGKEHRKYNPESTSLLKRTYYHLFKPKTNKKVVKK